MTAEPRPPKAPVIGTLMERGLHEDIKDFLAMPGDRFEHPVEGFVADIFRNGGLIEVQTGNFGAIRRKLAVLLEHYPVHLVHPIAAEKAIVRQDGDGRELGRRFSPKRGIPADIFGELISIRDLAMHPNLTFEVMMVREEEFRRLAPGRRRGPRWRPADNRLVEVLDRITLSSARDFRALLPTGLEAPFTNRDLAKALGRSMRDAGAMTYTMRRMGVVREVGKRGNAILYI